MINLLSYPTIHKDGLTIVCHRSSKGGRSHQGCLIIKVYTISSFNNQKTFINPLNKCFYYFLINFFNYKLNKLLAFVKSSSNIISNDTKSSVKMLKFNPRPKKHQGG